MDTEPLQKILAHPVSYRILSGVLGLVVVVMLASVTRRAALASFTDTDVRYRVRKLIDLTSYVVVALVVLTTLSSQLSGLTVAMGGISVGVGLALQEVVISFAGWLAISAGGFFRVGDRVQLGGIMGDVIDIGILRTTLMECGAWVKGDLYNGRIVRVANSFVFKEPVFNYSGDFPYLWDEIVLPVKYGGDYALARQILARVAEEVTGETAEAARATWQDMVKRFRLEDARVEPLVTLIANDNWLEFTIRYVTSYQSRRGTKDRLFSRILDEIARTDGRVQLASMTVHLVEMPPVDVRLPKAEAK